MFNIRMFHLGPMQTNSYLIWDDNKIGYLFDCGGKNIKALDNFIKENNIQLKYLILTHGHGDHIDGSIEILEKNPEAQLYIGDEEKEFLTDDTLNLTNYMLAVPFKYTGKFISVKEGDKIGDFQVIDTPGHTRGSKCFYCQKENLLISGDTMFQNSFGRYDLPTGNESELFMSLKKLCNILPDNTIVLSGHTDSTTIGNEKQFLKKIRIL
ncbi:MBL fold metallo-hydrolase [Fusobacterium sp. PH5-44]|uniref:MBL fold metallo-hydrolase n=1 Tax=unclassified Fusobacterium TaxID=2648384 RepID=UPI003D1F28FE